MNIKLLSYATEQRAALDKHGLGVKARPVLSLTACARQWTKLSIVQKTYVGVAVGLIVQVSARRSFLMKIEDSICVKADTHGKLTTTLVLFFGSRRFHASYGFFSTHTDPATCRTGAEWYVKLEKGMFID